MRNETVNHNSGENYFLSHEKTTEYGFGLPPFYSQSCNLFSLPQRPFSTLMFLAPDLDLS